MQGKNYNFFAFDIDELWNRIYSIHIFIQYTAFKSNIFAHCIAPCDNNCAYHYHVTVLRDIYVLYIIQMVPSLRKINSIVEKEILRFKML